MQNLDDKVIYIFPGQGSQYVGMGSDIYADYGSARDVYQQASTTLGFDMAELSFNDPEDKLNRTQFTQLALLTHSIACLRVFEDLNNNKVTPFVCAGHSLGEYSSLVAAGALTFEDALQLVKKRGELMSEYGRGKMIAFPMDLETVRSFVSSYYCGIGGCNLPQQTVVGGTEEDLQAVADHATEHYSKKGTFLNTEGAFHTYLMTKAAEAFRPHLEATPMATPKVKVISNFSGNYHADDPARIKALLFFQLFNPVKWIWSMQRVLKDDVQTIIEFGGGIGSGENPDEKRPNLAGITKKAIKSVNRYGRYIPAINSATLKRSTAMTKGIDGKQFYLLIPKENGEITKNYMPFLNLIDKSGLASAVQVICAPEEQNLEMLKQLEPNADKPRACLWVLEGGQVDRAVAHNEN
ncbi:MAG: ACP S-malonyltransferase, partial [Pseudomonadales bacterium]